MGAFNGFGQFVRSYLWSNDAANAINITASRMDTEDNGFAAGLSNCITRDGQSPALANLPMGGFKLTGLADGAAPGEALTYSQLNAALGANLIAFSQSASYNQGTLGKNGQTRVSVKDAPFLAVGDGVSDDTAAIMAAIAFVKGTGGTLVFPGGTYLVSIITFDGSNYNIDTSAGVLFKQKTGTVADVLGPPAAIRFISATRVTCGNLNIIGNITVDTGEDHHAVGLSQCKSVTIGRIFATNVRGDSLYCYARNTSEAERQRACYVAEVSGTNVYRNLLTVVGGQVHVGAVVNAGPVGYRDFDVEPNNSSGSYEAVDLQIDYARIGSADLTSDDAAVINYSARIGILDADLSRVQATTPAYPFAPGSGAYALGVSRTEAVEIGYFRARNYNVWVLNLASSWSMVDIGELDIANCSLTDVTFNALIVQQGNAGVGCVRIGTLSLDAANTKRLATVQGAGLLKIVIDNIKLWKGLIGSMITGRISNGTIDINGSSGTALANSSNVIFENVTTTNYGSATLSSGCTAIMALNSSLFGTTADGINMVVGGAVRVAGVKVLGLQGGSVADAVGGTVIDSEARVALNLVLARLRAHGIIA